MASTRRCSRAGHQASTQRRSGAKRVVTEVMPQERARTMPKLQRASTVAWAGLRVGKWVDTVVSHCDNPAGRDTASSWYMYVDHDNDTEVCVSLLFFQTYP